MLITAHSGAENTKNNSMEYLKKAINLNCDVIEIDIRFINGLYLTHDEVESNECLVELEEALDIIKQSKKYINCDLKEFGLLKKVLEVIKQKKLIDRTFYSGSISKKINEQFILECKKNNILDKIIVNFELLTTKINDENYNKTIEYISKLGIKQINVNYKIMNKERIKLAHQKNVKVYVWTVDELEKLNDMIEIGVDSITTYNVNDLYAISL